MPVNAIAYGTTVEALSKMSFQQYLKYVAMHFKPYAKKNNRATKIFICRYFGPVAVGQPEITTRCGLFGSKAYSQNDGLRS